LIYGAEDDPVTETRVEGLREGLHRLDWVEGHNLALDFRFGAADPRRIRDSAKELVALGPDVIVTGAAPATRAVLELTQTIPVVFVEVTNETPVQSGIRFAGVSQGDHGGRGRLSRGRGPDAGA
jgi:putative ABC transport system substrate-binding protein